MGAQSSSLPLLVVVFPLVGSGVLASCARRGEALRSAAANLISLITLLLSVFQFAVVQKGRVLFYALDWYVGFGLRWKADHFSAVFAVVVALVWLLATIFSRQYMEREGKQTRFAAASLFTLGSTLGVFLAGDLLSLFLFFELMTFAAYLLVVHSEGPEALRAGSVYLFMSVIGGLFLLGAIFFIQHTVGHTEFVPVLDELLAAGLSPTLLFGVIILGFGVKAGMLPLHIWLPKAHPVAPAPASALLSALMIKTGAYGFFRFFTVFLSAQPQGPHFYLQQNFGYALIWIGAVTMLGGALMALIHSPMKRVLAYSSISQMGYILFALGTGVMLGQNGAVGLAAAWLHMINHAFFKSFLFLLAGAVYLQTGELDLNKLGGLGRRMPKAFLFFLIAAAGITGIPGFNGYASKVLIHEAILHAYHLKGWDSLLWLERTFVFTGGLTAAYISKIWLQAFVMRPTGDYSNVRDLSGVQTGLFAVYSAILLSLGIGAQRAVNRLVLPVLASFDLLGDDLKSLGQVPFWAGAELQAPLVSYAIAAFVVAVLALCKFSPPVPGWLSVEKLVYRPLFTAASGPFKQGERTNLAFDTVIVGIILAAVLAILLWQ